MSLDQFSHVREVTEQFDCQRLRLKTVTNCVIGVFYRDLELEIEMAKRAQKGTGTSRVRFIMLEAEIPEGDLTEVTEAIQNALRPAVGSISRVSKSPAQLAGKTDADQNAEIVNSTLEVEEEFTEEVSTKSGSTKQRRPVKRKVVEMDLDSEVSLSDYVDQYPPQNEQDRYLVSVAYICEHRQDIEGVTADHVYTCFRKLEWPTGSKDFAQPLRNLKVSQLLDPGPTRGTYQVNHIGLDRVHKLAEE